MTQKESEVLILYNPLILSKLFNIVTYSANELYYNNKLYR